MTSPFNGISLPRLLCICIPLLLFTGLFIAFVVFVLYNLQIFTPIAPIHGDIGCDFLLGEGHEKRSLANYVKNRVVSNNSQSNSTQRCSDIKRRRYLPTDVPDFLLVHHYVVFIRHVSKDYDYTETVLTMLYSPLHFYCLTIDKNATEEFKEEIRLLSRCVTNVIVPTKEYDGSNARELFQSHKDCFDTLERYPWEHAVITQEELVPTQSLQAIAHRLSQLGPSVKIGLEVIHMKDDEKQSRLEKKVSSALAKWLHTRRQPIFITRSFEEPLYDYILSDGTIEAIEKEADSMPTVANNDTCRTNRRGPRGNCIYGMEMLKEAVKSPLSFVHADPSFDFGFVQCMHEVVFRRTYKDAIPTHCEHFHFNL